MAKNKQQEKEQEKTPVVAQAEQTDDTKKEPKHYMPKMGTVVHYFQDKTGSIGQLEAFPAMVLGAAAKESNFKPEDLAVDLHVFKRNRHGGCQERQGVMFSEEPKAGKWTWAKG